MLSANKDSFISSLHIRMCFIYFSCYWDVKLDIPVLSLIFGGIFFGLSPLSMISLWALQRRPLSGWESFLSSPSLLRVLSWINVGFYQMLFLQLLNWSNGVHFSFVNMVNYIDWFSNGKSTLHSWNKSPLVMKCYILLDLISQSFA